MAGNARKTMICDCGGTMDLDAAGFGRGPHTKLCREQLGSFEEALEGGDPLLVACTQEAPLFGEIGAEADLRFVNIRERAGWTEWPGDPGPKIAALLAEAALESRPPRLRSVASEGHVLVIGPGQVALDTAIALSARMPATTLLLTGADDLLLPPVMDTPVLAGTPSRLVGSLGRFTASVPGARRFDPTSRAEARFGPPADRTFVLDADCVLDLTGGTPLVTGPHKRDGYERADPSDAAGVARAMLAVTDFVGDFEKPIYVEYDPGICAHSRNRITGCTNCLDACPAGAIEPAGDGVAIDALVCAGCGSCAAHCPTGAVAYAAPRRDDLIARIHALLTTYGEHGGERPVLLLHDDAHGGALINASARLGRGLPVEVLPVALHAGTIAGHDHMLAAAASGAGAVLVLCNPQRSDELATLKAEIAIANAIGEGLGGSCRASMLIEADPESLEIALGEAVADAKAASVRHYALSPDKREMARNLIVALASEGAEPFALPQGAPYGRIAVDAGACTLCMACVSACPAGAIRDNEERPELRFVEASCVQCGICARTCPEDAITLETRLDPTPAAQAPVTLNEEPAAECTRCGTGFAARSTVERMVEKLSGHWMYRGERAALLRMCDTCRLEEQAAGGRDPFAVGERPRPTTTADYASKPADAKPPRSVSDFLSD